jgi:teichuronic acid biosynthesis glycosyltransferase TuaH
MLKDKVIVFLGNTRFDGNIKSTSLFIARNLAVHNEVYFIDYPFTLKDYISYMKTDVKKERENKFSIFSDGLINTDLPNLKIVITPPVLPINFLPEGFIFRFILKINEFIITLRMKKIFKDKKIKDFIFINSFNFHYPGLAKRIKPELTVYHCVDPMIVPYDMKHGIISEKKLVLESDLVICTSVKLTQEKILLNPNTYFVPNASDSDNGFKEVDENMPVHDNLRHIRPPVIGYLGTIERRIDYHLLKMVVDNNKDKNFVIAGPIEDGYLTNPLFKSSNVFTTGAVPYLEVPQMINSFDLAIIPFKKDEVSRTIFPIKLFEYLSFGKPVVSTDFNLDLKDFTGNMVDYCSDPKLFTDAINEALKTDSPQKVEERKLLAKQNTWKKRSEHIAAILKQHLELKRNQVSNEDLNSTL